MKTLLRSCLVLSRLPVVATFFAAALVLTLNAPVRGDLADVVDNSITHVVTEVVDHEISGNEMGGMQIFLTYLDDTTDFAVWAATGPVGAGAAGPGGASGWLLSQTGDTFTAPWTFSNDTGKGVKKLAIHAGEGKIVLDRTQGFLGLGEGTIDSNIGLTFNAGATDNALTGSATYSQRVATTDNHGGVPQNDIYAILTLLFTNAGGFASGGADLIFDADTDMISAAVPEPSAFLFGGLVCGVIGAGAVGRRFRTKKASQA